MPEEQVQQQSSQSNGKTPSLTENLKADQSSSSAAIALEPELLKQYPSLSKFKTRGDLAKSYIELEKTHGGSVRIPDEKATPEQRAEFNRKLGAPEKAEGYEFKRPEGVAIDEGLESWFRKAAFENGIPKATAEKLYDGFIEQAQGLIENAAGSSARYHDELKKEWGYATDRNVRIAGNTLGHLIAMTGDKPDENHEMVKFLNETHLGDHPALVRFFYKLASKFGEDQLIETDVGPSAEDVESAKQELAEIMKPKGPDGKKSPYWLGDKAAVARAFQLRELIGASK